MPRPRKYVDPVHPRVVVERAIYDAARKALADASPRGCAPYTLAQYLETAVIDLAEGRCFVEAVPVICYPSPEAETNS